MKWHPVSVIVIILTIVVGTALLAATFMPLYTKMALPPEVMKLMETLFTSAMSIITLYVGAMVQRKVDERNADR